MFCLLCFNIQFRSSCLVIPDLFPSVSLCSSSHLLSQSCVHVSVSTKHMNAELFSQFVPATLLPRPHHLPCFYCLHVSLMCVLCYLVPWFSLHVFCIPGSSDLFILHFWNVTCNKAVFEFRFCLSRPAYWVQNLPYTPLMVSTCVQPPLNVSSDFHAY